MVVDVDIFLEGLQHMVKLSLLNTFSKYTINASPISKHIKSKQLFSEPLEKK